jgi:hypothetical protein
VKSFVFEGGRSNKTQLIGMKALWRRWHRISNLLLDTRLLLLSNTPLGEAVVNIPSHTGIPCPLAD